MEVEEINLAALVGGAVKPTKVIVQEVASSAVKSKTGSKKRKRKGEKASMQNLKNGKVKSEVDTPKLGVIVQEVASSAVKTKPGSKKRKRKGEKASKQDLKNGKVKPEVDTPKLEGMEIEQLPSFENVQLPSTNGSSKKKPKLGSKARKLLKLQKQQGQKGTDKNLINEKQINGKQINGKQINGKEISEEDLLKRENMELERLENVPSSEDVDVEEIDMSGWSRLRLHPLLMKALMKLKFSNPTPIQEACIGAAAFQGKDVIGAAETGSGKTLAFGLPILQRLLDDQEKQGRKTGSDMASKKQSGGPLRALIVTPTRELALQVCDHIRAVAQFTNANVVPIVGGMALQKQQRLLGYQPQIVVGTPGRLWELMNAGEKHLLDLSQLSFFVLDEADRMVEKGHFRELQMIMDLLPKSQNELAAEAEKAQGRKRRRENNRESKGEDEQGDDDEQEEENVEVYPDSDDDEQEEENVEVYPDSDDEDDLENGDEEQEEDVEDDDDDDLEGQEGDDGEVGDEGQEGDDEDGAEEDIGDGFFPAFPDEEESDADQQIEAEDISMDAVFPGRVNVEPLKKRQTLVFSATLALPPGFKKKLKRGFFEDKSLSKKNEYSVASLIQKAAMRSNAAIVDLTTKDILAKKLEESVIECRDEEKDAYLYYILKVHGCGRTLVFCTSIAALRRVTAILKLLQVNCRPLHAQMQQKQRLKAMDRFKGGEDCVMVATDVAARGLDVTGIRTVIHYQLPHSAEMYVHRSGRTARADTDGISIAIISPSDRAKYTTLCRALDKANGLPSFPIDPTYVPAILKRISLANQVDRVLRKHQQNKVKQSWKKRNAEALELDLEDSDDDLEEDSVKMPVEKRELMRVQNLQQELQELLKKPLEPKAFSRRYVTGSGITPVLANQLKEYTTPKVAAAKKGGKAAVSPVNNVPTKGRLLVIGQEAVEPLDALRRSVLNTSSLKPNTSPAPAPKSHKGKGASKSKRRKR